MKDGSVTTDAAGGAGLFAYGDGTVYASGTTVKTAQDTSGGVHVAGGGTLYGWDLDVETNGESSAAIRSDRGGRLPPSIWNILFPTSESPDMLW